MSYKSDDEFVSDIGEDEIDDELALPDVLRTIDYDEKRELYRFKHTHNEIEWETKIMERSEALSRKVDLERLKNMRNKGSAAPAAPVSAKTAVKKVDTKSATRGRRKVQSSDEEGPESGEEESDEDKTPVRSSKRKPVPAKRGTAAKKSADVHSDEEAEEDEGSAEESDASEDGNASESSEGSDLFDSDEEEAISKGAKVLGAKRKAGEDSAAVSTRSSRRGAAVKYSSGEEGEEEDEEEELYGRRLSKTTGRGKSGAFDDDGDDGNLGRIKERTRGPKPGARSGYDSDGSGKGHSRASKQPLSVQEQLKAEMAALMVADTSPPAELSDYLTIQPRRTDMIMKWLNEPYLKEALEGLYVRFTIGEVNGRSVCRMCKIMAVDLHGRGYKLAETGEFCTVRLSLLCGGEIRKLMRVCQISNSRITADEFDFYWKTNETAVREGKPSDQRLTKNQSRALRKLFMSHTVQHVYTDQEIKDMVKKSVGLDKSKVTEYSTAMESLEKKLAAARACLDYDTMEVVQKTIDSVQRRFQDEKEKYDRAAKNQLNINRRMKESNTLRDMKAGNRLRAEVLEAQAKGVQSKQEADPFSRRETRPTMLWNTGKKLEEARQAEGSKTAADTTAVEKQQDGASTTDTSLRAAAESNKPLWRMLELPSMDMIRRRVKQRLGVDPVHEASRSARDRYLERVCAQLPPLDSQERAALRQKLEAKSLDEALDSLVSGGGDLGGSAMEIEAQ